MNDLNMASKMIFEKEMDASPLYNTKKPKEISDKDDYLQNFKSFINKI